MKYDDASWHYGGEDYPEGLPQKNGGTHIGFFLAWLINNELISYELIKECKEDLKKVRNREMTGRDFLFAKCDGNLSANHLNEEGQEYTEFYFDNEEADFYFMDYEKALMQEVPSCYHVEDTWENYDKIAALIDETYNSWKESENDGEE